MSDRPDTDRVNTDEYTIVLNRNYAREDAPALEGRLDELRWDAEKEAPAEEKPAAAAEEQAHEEEFRRRQEIDRLYGEYEAMRLAEPGIVGKEEVYPHSYYWRIGDRYDPGKKAALEEAIRSHCKIEDTEAYAKYVEEIKGRKVMALSWD